MAPPDIEANRAFSVLKQLKDALSAIEDRVLFVSGSWEHTKSDYPKLLREWPVTEVNFHRLNLPGFWKIFALFKYSFILKPEALAFLVNVFRIFEMDRSIVAWSVD